MFNNMDIYVHLSHTLKMIIPLVPSNVQYPLGTPYKSPCVDTSYPSNPLLDILLNSTLPLDTLYIVSLPMDFHSLD